MISSLPHNLYQVPELIPKTVTAWPVGVEQTDIIIYTNSVCVCVFLYIYIHMIYLFIFGIYT